MGTYDSIHEQGFVTDYPHVVLPAAGRDPNLCCESEKSFSVFEAGEIVHALNVLFAAILTVSFSEATVTLTEILMHS